MKHWQLMLIIFYICAAHLANELGLALAAVSAFIAFLVLWRSDK